MVNDSLDGPELGALWALQHVTVNADGLGLCPAEVITRMGAGGFDASKCQAIQYLLHILSPAHLNPDVYLLWRRSAPSEVSTPRPPIHTPPALSTPRLAQTMEMITGLTKLIVAHKD